MDLLTRPRPFKRRRATACSSCINTSPASALLTAGRRWRRPGLAALPASLAILLVGDFLCRGLGGLMQQLDEEVAVCTGAGAVVVGEA